MPRSRAPSRRARRRCWHRRPRWGPSTFPPRRTLSASRGGCGRSRSGSRGSRTRSTAWTSGWPAPRAAPARTGSLASSPGSTRSPGTSPRWPPCWPRARSPSRAARSGSPSATPEGGVAGLAEPHAELPGRAGLHAPALDVRYAEDAGGGHAVPGCHLEDRGRLHLHGHRPAGGPLARRLLARVVEEVAAHDDGRARAGVHEPGKQGGVRLERSVGPERRTGAIGGGHGPRPPERGPAEPGIERAAGADADERRRAERDQLLADDRRARPAHARGLHRERLAVGGDPRVAP